ncbi:MAG: hypothetical protein HC880_06145 [Bacteroidia bacterium]|nr:hypothetical protein [Bacteroidia bacterium]
MRPLHPLVETIKNLFAHEPALERYLFNPPASQEEITAFRQKMPLPLPTSFYDFYSWYNGSRNKFYSQVALHEGRSVLTLRNILNFKTTWDTHEDNQVFRLYEPGTWWNKGWVPFMYIPDWYVAVIDTVGSFAGKAGQILGFDFKAPGDRLIMYESFEKWLETLIELKKSNALLYDAEDLDNPSILDRELGKKAHAIYEQINRHYAFAAPIWRYRRPEVAINQAFSTLQEAIAANDLDTLRKLIQNRKIEINEINPYDVDNYSPLLLAISLKNFEAAVFLLEQGADAQQKDANGYDAFQKIISEYNYQNNSVATLKVLDLLLNQGHRFVSEPHRGYGCDPLHQLLRTAIRLNDEITIRYCESRGANLNKAIPYHNGNSFLHEAIQDSRVKYETVELLIKLGSDKSRPNEDGETPQAILQKKYATVPKGMMEGVERLERMSTLIGK